MRILVMDDNKNWIKIDLSLEDVVFLRTSNASNPWRSYPVLTNGIFNIKVDSEWEAQTRE